MTTINSQIDLFSVESKQYQQDNNVLLLKGIKQEFNELVDELKTKVSQTSDESPHLHFILSSEVSDLVKAFGLYLRDAYLELVYASIKYKSSIISEEKLNSFKAAQLKEYEKYRSRFYAEVKRSLQEALSNADSEVSKLTENPFQIYTQQFETLKNQYNAIQLFENQSKQLNLKLNYISNTLVNVLENLSLNLSKFESISDKLELDNLNSAKEFLKSFETISKEINEQFSKQDELNTFVSKLEKIHVYPNHISGHLEARIINTPTLIQNWLTLSAYISIDAIEKRTIEAIEKQGLKYEFILDSEDEYGSIAQKQFINWKTDFHSELTTLSSDLKMLTKEFNSKLSLYSIFFKKEDHNLSLQKTYDQLLGTGTIWPKIKSKYQEIKKSLSNKVLAIVEKQTLNEQIIEAVKGYKQVGSNVLFKKLFLNETGLHDQVIVQRKIPTKKFEESLKNWQEGVGNSILITGNKSCGKTTFIETLNLGEVFHKKISLSIGQEIEVEGRKFKIGTNIKDVFEDILKSISTTQKYLIIIEDLEKWRTKEINIIQNMSSLVQVVDNAPNNIFILCSCNQMFFKKTNIILDIENVFSRIINLSRIELNEFLLTVFKRFEITQTVIEQINIFSQRRIKNISKKILKKNNNNIGTSILSWINYVNPDGSFVDNDKLDVTFPWIIDNKNKQLFDNLLVLGKCSYQDLLQNYPAERRPDITNLIGRYRRLAIIENLKSDLQINHNLAYKIEHQLFYIEEEFDKIHHYTLSFKMLNDMNLNDLETHVKYLLFFFPFSYDDSKAFINKFNNKLELELTTHETPKQIIQYINNHTSDFRLEFKHNR